MTALYSRPAAGNEITIFRVTIHYLQIKDYLPFCKSPVLPPEPDELRYIINIEWFHL